MDNRIAADLIFINGRVAIGDESGRITEAIAVKDGKILASGSNERINAFKGDNTRQIDLRGKLVVPGLIESHTHFYSAALSEIRGELFTPSSVKDLLNHIKERAVTAQKGEWIYCSNTYPVRLEELRFPTLDELDAISPENPVYIDGVYAGQANSLALRAAGLDERTVPPRGKLCRDDRTGKLNGVLFACGHLIKQHINFSEPSEEQIQQALPELQKRYNRLGITSVIDANTAIHDIMAYNSLYKQGELNLRFSYTCCVPEPDTAAANIKEMNAVIDTPADWGKLRYLKVFIDGGILTGTAYMRRPYGEKLGIPGVIDGTFRGVISFDRNKLCLFIRKACETGLQMTAHCIGDAALDVFLSAYEEVNRSIPIDGKRFSVIHADFTDENTIGRLQKLGIMLISQPAWHYRDGSALNEILDSETMASFLPYRRLLESGIVVCGGSDHMIKLDSFHSQNPYNPFIGLYNLITRKTEKGEAIQQEQQISRWQALKMYTANGAYATFDENKKGTLEDGKLADLAVLSKDYFTCAEEDIPKIESELTLVGGRVVYEI